MVDKTKKFSFKLGEIYRHFGNQVPLLCIFNSVALSPGVPYHSTHLAASWVRSST